VTVPVLANDTTGDTVVPSTVQIVGTPVPSAPLVVPGQSAVFVMTQLEQMTHEDAAAALGISVNHVAVLLFRARAALQLRLKHLVSAGSERS
jgi:hypothetical protein